MKKATRDYPTFNDPGIHYLTMSRSILVIILVAVISGLAYGLIVARTGLMRPKSDFEIMGEDPIHTVQGEDITGKKPKAVVVGPTEHKFGTMNYNAEGKHTFTIRNDGDAPLRLLEAGTTCGCTASKLKEDVVSPGKKTTVDVEWKTEGKSPEYRHSASIRTNDPDRPIINLSISGRVTRVISYAPDSITLSNKQAGETSTTEVRFYCFRKPAMKIVRSEWNNQQTAKYFDARFSPLSPSELEKPKALSGVKMVLSVKPGLPLGPIHQTIHLETNHKESLKISIPIRGRIVSDITLSAADYDSRTNLLDIGGVSQATGHVINMNLLVRGEHSKGFTLKVKSRRPDWLQVDIGKNITAGKLTRVPLTITIPPDSPVKDFLGPGRDGMGEIVFKTNHPDVPEIPISLYFNIDPPE